MNISAVKDQLRRQWVEIIRGFVTAAIRGEMRTDSERLAMLLLVGTIPAAVLGVYLESRIKALFASPYEAAGFLIANGFLMLGFEVLRRQVARVTTPDKTIPNPETPKC